MRLFLILLVMAAILLPEVSCCAERDYVILDKRGNYAGSARSDGRTTDFYDKSGRPDGWISHDTGYVFDRNNRVKGTIHDFGDDNDD